MSLSGAKLDAEFERHFTIQPEVPFVLAMSCVDTACVRLSDGESPAPARLVVTYLRLPGPHAVIEIKRGEFIGPGIDSQLAGAHLQIHPDLFGIVAVNRLKVVSGRSGAIDPAARAARQCQREYPCAFHLISSWESYDYKGRVVPGKSAA